MNDGRGLWLGGEEGIEAGDAECLRRRNGEARAEVVQRTRADPPNSRLNGVQDRQQEMPAVTRGLPSFGLAAGALVTRAPRPSGIRPPHYLVYGGALIVTGGRVRKMQVQSVPILTGFHSQDHRNQEIVTKVIRSYSLRRSGRTDGLSRPFV